MTSAGRVMTLALLALVASACIVRSSDDNRAEQFQFTPSPAGQDETIDAFREVIGPGGAGSGVLDEARS